VRLVLARARVHAAEVGGGLNDGRDAAGEPVTFRVALAQLGRQEVRQLDLADLALDLLVGHLRVEVVLEARLREEGDEELLRQVEVGAAAVAFLDEEAGAVGGAHQRVVDDEALQLRPEARNVRAA
jgi:hypothetical protein